MPYFENDFVEKKYDLREKYDFLFENSHFSYFLNSKDNVDDAGIVGYTRIWYFGIDDHENRIVF